MPRLIDKVKNALGDGWRRLVSRLGLWVNSAIGVFNKGIIDGGGEQRFMWVLGNTERHCSDCLHLDGQIKTASEWAAAGIAPQSPDLECGGWNCDCKLVPVSEET